ncbi:MAG: hypothetical protein ACRCYU_23550 [Nocardioides sp.]
MNPLNVTPRSAAFAAAVSGFESSVLLVHRSESGLAGYLATSGTGGDSMRAATNLAHAVGAKAEAAEWPAGLGSAALGRLIFESGSVVAREAQVGVDPAEAARVLATSVPVGCWVALVLRSPSKRERARHQRWLAHRLSATVPTHHSMSPDAVLMSVVAGGPDRTSVRSVLEATRSAMPGFDVLTKVRFVSRAGAFLRGLAWAAGWGVPAGIWWWASILLGLPDAVRWPGLVLPALALMLGVLRSVGVLGSVWRGLSAGARSGAFAPPLRRRARPRKPRTEVTTIGRERSARDGDYPLHKSAFQVGPQVAVGVVAPQAGAASGEAATRDRAVPNGVRQQIGPLLGGGVEPVYLSATDFGACVALVGKAGSGKSALLRSLFGWSCFERVRPSGWPGFPGARNALVAFESKGGGVTSYEQWAAAAGDRTLVIDVVDPTSWGIDIFAVPGVPSDRASFVANAMMYAFRDGAIQDKSFETLTQVFTAAFAITPEVAALAEGVPADASPMLLAHLLLGGRGDAIGSALANEVTAAAAHSGAPDLVLAAQALAPLYGAKTATSRGNDTSAPRNKVGQLVALESWWSPGRRKVTWDRVLREHRSVVINTGGTFEGRLIDDELSQQMSSLLMYSLQHAIRRECLGWQAQGRSVSVFSDELSLLAGSSEAVIAWLKDQGREFGVRAFLATQRPEQLPPRLRSVLLNFSTLISFMQDDVATAREVAENVSADAGEWSPADILHLPPFTAVVKTVVALRRQPAFTVAVGNFEADRVGYGEAQGYTGAPSVGPVAPTPVAPITPPVDDPGDDFSLADW